MLNKFTTWKTFGILLAIRLTTAFLASANVFNLEAFFTLLSTITFVLILIVVLNALGHYKRDDSLAESEDNYEV